MLFLAYLYGEGIEYPFDIVSLHKESCQSHPSLQDTVQERLIDHDGILELSDNEVYFPLEFFKCS